MKDIVIDVEAKWEKFDGCKRKDASGYSGGFNIPHHPRGYPQINLGFGTPDFGYYTTEHIRKMILNQYQSWFPDKRMIVKIKVIKDERVKIAQMEDFF